MAALAEGEPGDLPGALLHCENRRFLWPERGGRGSRLSSTSRRGLAGRRRMQPELLAIPGGPRERPARGGRAGGHGGRRLMQLRHATHPVTSPTEVSPPGFALGARRSPARETENLSSEICNLLTSLQNYNPQIPANPPAPQINPFASCTKATKSKETARKICL